VLPGVAERAGAITNPRESLDQCERDGRVEWVQVGGAAPPRQSSGSVSVHRRTLGERDERPAGTPRQAIALPIHPPLELRSVLQEESIQKWPRVKRGSLLQRLPVQGLLELRHIGRDHYGIETKCLSPHEQRLLADLPSLRIQQLVEHMTSPLRVGLGPEKGLQLVAAESSLSSHRQQREDGQPPALSDGAGEVLLTTGEGQPTEGAQPEPDAAVDSLLTGD
jgi:hypothetical protein